MNSVPARRLARAAFVLLALTSAARAVEIPAPAPLHDDPGAADGRTLLAHWSRRTAPASPDAFVTSTPTTAGDGLAPLIVAVDGRPALLSPFDGASTIPPRRLETPTEAGPFGGFGVLRGADGDDGGEEPAADALPGAPRGGTHFDARTIDRNPITLPGDLLDELTARVVRTPEPGTLALFALGAVALAALIARRRRGGFRPGL